MKQGDKTNNRKSLSEQQKRRKIRRVLNQEMMLMEHRKRVWVMLAEEDARLRSEGYSPAQINEQMGDMLGKIPDAGAGFLKQALIKGVLRHFGFTTDSIFGYIIVNIIEEAEWSNLSQYFGKGGCKPLTATILRGVQEGMAEFGIDKLLEALTGNRRMEGIIAGPLRELIGEYIKDMTRTMREPLEDYICSQSIGGLAAGLTGMFGGGMALGAAGKGSGVLDSFKSTLGFGGKEKTPGAGSPVDAQSNLLKTHNYDPTTGTYTPK